MSKSDEQIEATDLRKQRAAARKALPPTTTMRGGIANWGNADADLALQLVVIVARDGGAVRFGYTRDGGAYSIGIYSGDLSKTYYCNEKDGIDETIRGLIQYFDA